MNSTAPYVRRRDGDMWLGYLEQFTDYRDLHSGEISGVRSVAELAVK
jgi:hypothetical protein